MCLLNMWKITLRIDISFILKLKHLFLAACKYSGRRLIGLSGCDAAKPLNAPIHLQWIYAWKRWS